MVSLRERYASHLFSYLPHLAKDIIEIVASDPRLRSATPKLCLVNRIGNRQAGVVDKILVRLVGNADDTYTEHALCFVDFKSVSVLEILRPHGRAAITIGRRIQWAPALPPLSIENMLMKVSRTSSIYGILMINA